MNKYRRFTAVVLALLLTTCLSSVSSAETAMAPAFAVQKEIHLTVEQETAKLTSAPSSAVLWEYPNLTAGETAPEGTLTLCNDSEYEAKLLLTGIDLPYDDPEAIRYLNALHLTVSDGDTVVYDDVYARIMDTEGGLHLDIPTLRAGESKTYRISLRCDFAYDGKTNFNEGILWNFSSEVTYEGTRTVTSEQPFAKAFFIGACVLLAVVTVAAVVRVILHRRKSEKA